MIHQLLRLTRPLFVFDLETTGLDTQTARIIEIGFQEWTAEGLVKEWRSLVNPGVPIPAESVKVHHIDPTIMDKCAKCYGDRESHDEGSESVCKSFHAIPTFKQLAASLAKGFTNCDFAGKNVRYDLRVTAAEMARAGVEWSYAGARIVDADRLEQIGEPRTLSHLVKKHLKEDMGSEAHTALGDVQWSTRLIVAQLKAYQVLPRDLDQLHAAQWPGWIDGEGKFKFIDGVPCFGQWGKYAGQPMQKADKGYWQFILDKDFSPDVKALARDAKAGKFPEAKS